MARKRKAAEKRLSWRNVDREVVLAVVDICDGHSIFMPEAFTRVGAPPAIVAQHTQCYESDFSDHKATIYVDGKPVNQMLGVYGLDLVEAICSDLGVEYESKMGRGFQYSACRAAIRAHLKATEVGQ